MFVLIYMKRYRLVTLFDQYSIQNIVIYISLKRLVSYKASAEYINIWTILLTCIYSIHTYIYIMLVSRMQFRSLVDPVGSEPRSKGLARSADAWKNEGITEG